MCIKYVSGLGRHSQMVPCTTKMPCSVHTQGFKRELPGLYTRKYELKNAEADSHIQLPLFMLRKVMRTSAQHPKASLLHSPCCIWRASNRRRSVACRRCRGPSPN